MSMSKSHFEALLVTIQKEERETREAGQNEYARDIQDAFGNFNRLSTLLGVDRKFILAVYAGKHWDGILSYISGNKSQREDVRGRIKDLRLYLALLWGMIEEEENSKNE